MPKSERDQESKWPHIATSVSFSYTHTYFQHGKVKKKKKKKNTNNRNKITATKKKNWFHKDIFVWVSLYYSATIKISNNWFHQDVMRAWGSQWFGALEVRWGCWSLGKLSNWASFELSVPLKNWDTPSHQEEMLESEHKDLRQLIPSESDLRLWHVRISSCSSAVR